MTKARHNEIFMVLEKAGSDCPSQTYISMTPYKQYPKQFRKHHFH